LLSKLGKHRMTKSCLYFRQLADLDRSALEKLVAGSIADVRRRYGTGAFLLAGSEVFRLAAR
jgi:hypothetical protein